MCKDLFWQIHSVPNQPFIFRQPQYVTIHLKPVIWYYNRKPLNTAQFVMTLLSVCLSDFWEEKKTTLRSQTSVLPPALRVPLLNAAMKTDVERWANQNWMRETLNQSDCEHCSGCVLVAKTALRHLESFLRLSLQACLDFLNTQSSPNRCVSNM